MVFTEPREQLLVSFIFRIYFQAIYISAHLLLVKFIQVLSLYASYNYTPLLLIAIYISYIKSYNI